MIATIDLWSRLAKPLEEFKRTVVEADRAALKAGSLPAEAADQLSSAVTALPALLADVLADAATPQEQAMLGARTQAELLPYLLLSRNAERWYAKPRGYAGDFLSIAWIYGDEAAGVGRIGPALDRGFLHVSACRAVYNRRRLLADEISCGLAEQPDRPLQVTSLACGPAQELLDVFAALDDPGAIAATLVDVDALALDHVRARVAGTPVDTQLTFIQENLVYAAAGRRPLPVADQDLVYSIGLIDYFPDRIVVALMNLAHRMLRPGGRLILGNFHPANGTKAFMDHVLAWPLIHRDEADLDRLYAASAFGRASTSIRFEAERINLFAECVKQ
ncbi:SAM-dependent methyltransferase [Micromonospora sp. SL4-19]|uniref:SAM-dependent methyltransferase n=1 Tax=Micromonospora sp. SL4-19 TaxID=3399129 RepID=UPI003A4E1823